MYKTIFHKIIKNYTLAFLTIWFGAMLLKGPDTSVFAITIGIYLIHGWVYFVHRSLHILPRTWPIKEINTHIRYHHQNDKEISRPLELFFEFLTDTAMNLSVVPLQWLLGITIIPLPCVLLFTLTYSSIHIINYSMFGSEFHKRHHITMDKNFAPDAMDHIIGTNFNEEYEDLNPTCLNLIVCTFLLYLLKDQFI